MKKGQTPNPAVIKKPEIKTKQIRQKALLQEIIRDRKERVRDKGSLPGAG